MKVDENKKIMPVVFVGHGSPMNAIEDNSYTESWKKIADSMPKPKAIVAISAHWTTNGTGVTAMSMPKTIHDFGDGFPDELFATEYNAPGSPELARVIKERIKGTEIILDEKEWGLDHGTWSVLKQMYPDADIPVVQFSIDYYKPASYHYNLAKELDFLREQGVLIIATGNVVHNLRTADFHSPEGTYDWARRFDEYVRENVLKRDHQALINYESLGKDALLSVPTPEHYYPFLYILALQRDNDKVSFPTEGNIFGSLSMRSVLFA